LTSVPDLSHTFRMANPETRRLMAMAQQALPVSFKLNNKQEVVMVRGSNRQVLGSLDKVGEEMARFLGEIDFGERS
jgi:hypothetical protein